MYSYSSLRGYVTELKQLGVSSEERSDLIENNSSSQLERRIYEMKADLAKKNLDMAGKSFARFVVYSSASVIGTIALKNIDSSASTMAAFQFYASVAAVAIGLVGTVVHAVQGCKHFSRSSWPKLKTEIVDS